MMTNMKHSINLIMLAMILSACESEFIGQYPVDDVPPAQVSNAQVENKNGGAVISYTLPNDTDLLYVKAVYTDSHGQQNEVRASMFKNSLEIKGFARSQKHNVQLISVDRSQNESAPVVVEIEPKDSPIYAIKESLKLEATWGGFKLYWDNPEKEQIFMYVTTPGEEGDINLDTIISSDSNGNGSVRGLEAKEMEFNIVIRDVYENYTDTVKAVLTPLYEKFLEPDNFVLTPLATNMKWHKSRNNVGALFDGVKLSDKPMYLETKVKVDGIPYSYFTVDLGDTFKLSRVKFWGRVKYCYANHCPNHFQMWGTASMEAAANPDNWNGWELLLDDWSYKPSGSETTDVTDEDKEYAEAGEEFEIPESCSALRYFRFVCLETWTKSPSLTMNELEFYGAEQSIY